MSDARATTTVGAPLLREFEGSGTAGLLPGAPLVVPPGQVALAMTNEGKVTDLLPPGSYTVSPAVLPGLSQTVSLGPDTRGAAKGAIFFLNVEPVGDLPWGVELDASAAPGQGKMLARISGRLGVQVNDSRHFFTQILAAAIQHVRTQKQSEQQSFKLTTGRGAERIALANLPAIAFTLLTSMAEQAVLESLGRRGVTMDALAGSGLALRADAEPVLSAWLAALGLQVLQFDVDPVQAAVRAPCARCGSETAPTGQAKFRRNISLFYVRYDSSVEGNYCARCATLTSLGYNGTMLVCGWWGIIGAIVTPIYLVSNFWNLGRLLTGPKGSTRPSDPPTGADGTASK